MQGSASPRHIADQLPNKKRKTPPKQVLRKVWILRKGDQVLLCRRPAKTVLGGLWEFPGLEEGQDENAFCKEFGLTPAKTVESVFTAEHTFTHIHWIMQVFEAAVDHDPVTDRSWRWIKTEALDQVMIPTAFRKIVEYIQRGTR